VGVGLISKNNELLADCFAGVWTTTVHDQGRLDNGDVAEALAALDLMGDQPTTDGSTPAYPHGTPAERENAFPIGSYGTTTNPVPAVPRNCLNTYWPGYTGAV
jgi:predicted metalloprotease